MLSCWASLLLLAAPTPTGEARVGVGPQPSPTPVSWEIRFTFLDPQRIEVQLPGTDKPEVYWYIVYTASNTSRQAQQFFPLFQIVTDDLRVFETDMGISPLVFDAVAERHKITHKYLVHPTKAIGPLLSGDDNARESVAIWRGVDLTSNSFKLFVAGLSGETRFIPNPAHDPTKPETKDIIGPDGRVTTPGNNPKFFTLRKTLEISYTVPGSQDARSTASPLRDEVRWVMR